MPVPVPVPSPAQHSIGFCSTLSGSTSKFGRRELRHKRDLLQLGAVLDEDCVCMVAVLVTDFLDCYLIYRL